MTDIEANLVVGNTFLILAYFMEHPLVSTLNSLIAMAWYAYALYLMLWGADE